MPKVLLSLNFCTNKGFEQAVKKQSGGLFFRRGNEQSEAIGAGSTETKSLSLRQFKESNAEGIALFKFLYK